MFSTKEALSVKNEMLKWDKLIGQHDTLTIFAPIFATVLSVAEGRHVDRPGLQP